MEIPLTDIEQPKRTRDMQPHRTWSPETLCSHWENTCRSAAWGKLSVQAHIFSVAHRGGKRPFCRCFWRLKLLIWKQILGSGEDIQEWAHSLSTGSLGSSSSVAGSPYQCWVTPSPELGVAPNSPSTALWPQTQSQTNKMQDPKPPLLGC